MFYSVDATTPLLAYSGLQRCFESWAAAKARAVALTFEGMAVTFAALNVRAKRIAHRLIELGAGPETLVGLFIERTPNLIACMVGIVQFLFKPF